MVKKQRKQPGFTIVELLIVIVVIGILAAITIVAYNGIQERARASSVSSALSQAVKKISLWQVDNPSMTPSSLATAGVTDSNDVTFQYTPGTSGTYCITATAGPTSYKITNSTQPTAGGCSGHGQGGVAAVTNYVRNPNVAGTVISFGYAGAPVAATRTIASDQAHAGTTSLKTVVTGASGQIGSMAFILSQQLQLNVGEQVSWSFWAYSTKVGTLQPYVEGNLVVGGAYHGGSGGGVVSIPANTWTKVSGNWTANQNMYISQIGGYNIQVVAGDTLWFDEFMATKTSTQQTYADGGSANWTWNGVANDSSSTGPPL